MVYKNFASKNQNNKKEKEKKNAATHHRRRRGQGACCRAVCGAHLGKSAMLRLRRHVDAAVMAWV